MLKIIDISNPEYPQLAGAINTMGTPDSLTVAENNLYLICWSYGQKCLQVIDIADPEAPESIGFFCEPGGISGHLGRIAAVAKNKVYVVSASDGITVIDASSPEHMQIIGTVDTPGASRDAEIVNDKAYITNGSDGLFVMPLPVEIQQVEVESETNVSVTIPSPEIAGNYTLRVFNEEEHYELYGVVTFIEPGTPIFQDNK